ncbi:MAG: polysaccharide deacetylase family protein [Planctomycetota bacterium]
MAHAAIPSQIIRFGPPPIYILTQAPPVSISMDYPDLPQATISLDLDNKWSYLKSHDDPQWEAFPSYLGTVVPRILTMLDELGIKITFFVVGQDAVIQENVESLQQIANAGHEIANHSFHHETWLHSYTPEQLVNEFDLSEQAIQAATGKRPVGFRGPGFSLSDQTLEILASRGYHYDCTTFPTFMAPAARAFYFMTGKFNKEQKQDRNAMFGKFADGLLPNKPFLWKAEPGDLLEIPVSTFPGIKIPIHATYLQYLASYSSLTADAYFWSALNCYRIANLSPSFLLHPTDFLGSDDEPDLDFFPGMKVSSIQKNIRIKSYLQAMVSRFTIVRMKEFAAMALQGALRRRSTDLVRAGAMQQ